MRKILRSLIEASQKILCLDPSAAKLFKQVEGVYPFKYIFKLFVSVCTFKQVEKLHETDKSGYTFDEHFI